MNITKRDGRTETFDQAKIRAAIDKAFQNSGVFPSDARLDEIVASVVNRQASGLRGRRSLR